MKLVLEDKELIAARNKVSGAMSLWRDAADQDTTQRSSKAKAVVFALVELELKVDDLSELGVAEEDEIARLRADLQ